MPDRQAAQFDLERLAVPWNDLRLDLHRLAGERPLVQGPDAIVDRSRIGDDVVRPATSARV